MTQNHGAHKWRLLLLSAVIVGCQSTRSQPEATPQAAPTEVKRPKAKARIHYTGKGLLAANVGGARLSPSEFSKRFARYIEKKRRHSARDFVDRFPDLALTVLRSADPEASAELPMQWLALMVDARSGRKHWVKQLNARAGQASAYKPYFEARKALKQHLKLGQFDQAASLDLLSLSKAAKAHRLTEIEALELQAIAALAANHPKAAQLSLKSALALSRRDFPQQAVTQLLLLSDSQRRLKQPQAALSAWQQSLDLASQQRLCDPIYWEKAAYLWPAGQALPKAVAERLAAHLQAPKAVPGRALLSIHMAEQRLRRGEFQSALLASKRAETESPERAWQQRSRLLQARALLDLEQTGAATALLRELALDKSQPAGRSRALALLGTMNLQQEQLRTGLALLEQALSESQSFEGREQAMADLGLAYLLNGDEDKGRSLLHTAQRAFKSSGQVSLLLRCLKNEAQYLAYRGREDDALLLTQRVAAVELR